MINQCFQRCKSHYRVDIQGKPVILETEKKDKQIVSRDDWDGGKQ